MNFPSKHPDNGKNSSRSRAQSSPLADLSDRLVTLCDGRLGLRSGLHVDVTEPMNLVAPRSTSSLSSSGGEGQGEEAVSNSIRANLCNSCPAPPCPLSPSHGEKAGERGLDATRRKHHPHKPS